MLKLLTHFLDLLFPKLCIVCGESLHQHETDICTACLYHLPKTFLHEIPDNAVESRFWGKVPIERATALFYFEKQSGMQQLLHHLKYKGNKEIGETLGKVGMADLLNPSFFADVDVVVPVPLHVAKLKKRGYNQSEWIAKGIAVKLQKPIDNESLCRNIDNSTQTNKNRMERWENVSDVFCLRDMNAFEDKHVLLVDDVLTTGATIEACAKTVLQSPNAKVSIVALAMA